MAKQFSQSSFMKKRHANARAQRSAYMRVTGKNRPHSEFLQSSTPLLDIIEVYEVSYQLNYSSSKNAMKIKSPETFTVYALKTDNARRDIFDNTVNAVQNMKSGAGNTFQSAGTQTMIADNLRVDINKKAKPRGMEKVEPKDIPSDAITGLAKEGFYVKALDTPAEITNKAGSKFKMKTDLTLYFR